MKKINFKLLGCLIIIILTTSCNNQTLELEDLTDDEQIVLQNSIINSDANYNFSAGSANNSSIREIKDALIGCGVSENFSKKCILNGIQDNRYLGCITKGEEIYTDFKNKEISEEDMSKFLRVSSVKGNCLSKNNKLRELILSTSFSKENLAAGLGVDINTIDSVEIEIGSVRIDELAIKDMENTLKKLAEDENNDAKDYLEVLYLKDKDIKIITGVIVVKGIKSKVRFNRNIDIDVNAEHKISSIDAELKLNVINNRETLIETTPDKEIYILARVQKPKKIL